MRSKRFISGIMALLLVVLAGCGAGGTGSSTAKPGETYKAPATGNATLQAPTSDKSATELVVWTKFENEAAVVKQISAEWAAKTGNKVIVEYFQPGFQEYLTIAAAGKGPDVYFGIPHDNLGTFHKAGFLDPVPANVIKDSDFSKGAIDAVSYDGKKFAVPVTVEAIALMYNKKLVPTPPKTWDEFLKVAKEKGFAYDARNFYFSYGFIGGNGGFVFENKGGALDPKSVGLGTAGAQAGLQTIVDLVHTHKLFPADAGYDYMQGNFEAGKIGMILNGPWGVDGAKKAGVDLAVAPMPTLANGKPFNPFIGVYAAFVAADSKKKAVAWEYVKYMTEQATPDMFKVGKRLPAKLSLQEINYIKDDPISNGYIQSANNGTPMPNIPAMAVVWSPAADMLGLALDRKGTIAQVTSDAVKKINEGVASQK